MPDVAERKTLIDNFSPLNVSELSRHDVRNSVSSDRAAQSTIAGEGAEHPDNTLLSPGRIYLKGADKGDGA